MKKLFLLPLLMLSIYACEKDHSVELSNDSQIEFRKKKDKVEICHFDATTGQYRTMRVNPMALPGHLRHGDTEGACSDCDPSCLFCEYINLLDFDEPCSTNAYATGDYYSSCDFTQECNPENPSLFVEKGESALYDHDYFRNQSCGGNDPENDQGFFFASHEIACNGTPFGQVQFFYRNHDNEEENINVEFFAATQEAYDLAVYCRSVIDGLAAQYGMPNSCESE